MRLRIMNRPAGFSAIAAAIKCEERGTPTCLSKHVPG
jgi:hypothetical protein